MPVDYERTLAAIDQEEIESTVPPETPRTRHTGGLTARAAIAWLETHALFVAAVCAVIVLSLAQVSAHLSQDGWLALVAGRLIANHGIPHHSYLTVMANGVRWTDQQWLAQLGIYGFQQLGGLALYAVAYVAMTGSALAMTIAAARRLGATERHVIWVLPLGAFFYMATAVSIRTQGFAYPMFAATLALLATEVRTPTRRRVYLVFPILIVWANLHGSVSLGVGLAVIYGLTLLVQSARSRGWAGVAHARGLAFVIGAPLCLFVTPYGFSITNYYSATLFNSAFGKLVTEWRPVTSVMLLAVPFLLLVIATVWLLGRSGNRTPLFDQAVLIVLGLGAIFAVRNITWFGLAAIMLLPYTIGQVAPERPEAPRRERLNRYLATASVALAALTVIVTLARPASWFERGYDQRAVSAVAGILARDPGAKVFADVHYADWLIWHDPGIAGHVAYDTSFELLTSKQLAAISDLTQQLAPGQRDTLAPYSVLVLDPKNKSDDRKLLSRPGVRVVLRSKKVIVATKPVT